jgi:phosphatidate cytidylyltransferase
MLQTRLWMGAILIGLVFGVLLLDREPVYPFLLLLLVFLALIGAFELNQLLGPTHRPAAWLSVSAVLIVLLANWPAHLRLWAGDPWQTVLGAFAGVVLAAFLWEMAAYQTLTEDAQKGQESGGAVIRMALLVWTTAYLGLLPSFLAQLRWDTPTTQGPEGGPRYDPIAALVLAIFVPKCCDIGAYFTGRLLGRHPMTPVLSPKKTWEGLAGGLLLSIGVAIAINRRLPVLRGGDLSAAGFGLVVGGIGALGDLAESLVKRDCRRKDASQVVPGFGGVLDVVDSVVFAAPVAYWWLKG